MPKTLCLSLLTLSLSFSGGCTKSTDGLGQQGEECLTDIDCAEGLLCLGSGSCGEDNPEWPVDGDPLTLPAPEGVYVTFDIKTENSNEATRQLNPYIDRALSQAQVSLVSILQQDVGGLPFILTLGSATGALPEGFTFFEGQAAPREVLGEEIFVDSESVNFITTSSPPRTAPAQGFYMVLKGEGFDIPIPVSTIVANATVSNPGGGSVLELRSDAVILRRLAAETTVEIDGVQLTLEDFLGPDTQDIDFERDGTMDGWSLRISMSGTRQ